MGKISLIGLGVLAAIVFEISPAQASIGEFFSCHRWSCRTAGGAAKCVGSFATAQGELNWTAFEKKHPRCYKYIQTNSSKVCTDLGHLAKDHGKSGMKSSLLATGCKAHFGLERAKSGLQNMGHKMAEGARRFGQWVQGKK